MAGQTQANVGPIMTAKCSDSSIAVGRLLQIDTTNTSNTELVVKAATADTQWIVGVTTDLTAAANRDVSFQIYGVCRVDVDGSGTAISEGDKIVATTAGQGVKFTAVDATSQNIVGVALAPSAADGDLIPVLIDRMDLVKGSA